MNDLGNNMTEEDFSIVCVLLKGQIPETWNKKLLNAKGYSGFSVIEWLGSLLSKYQHIERLILTNKDKVACFWLGSFQKPESLLSFFKEEISSQLIRADRSGNYRDVKCFVEFTNKFIDYTLVIFYLDFIRDKDHIREPPSDGIYVYGLHLWGCGFDKGTGELLDIPIKGTCTPLPVAHITFIINDQVYNN